MSSQAGTQHEGGTAASDSVKVGDGLESIEEADVQAQSFDEVKTDHEDGANAFFEEMKSYEQAAELDLDKISVVAEKHHVRVCVYGCSLLERVKKSDVSKPKVPKKDDESKNDYQKVLCAMRSDDLRVVGYPQSKVVYCICKRKDAGKGFSLCRLPDVEDKQFGLHEGGGKGRTTCSLCAWAYPIQDADHFDTTQRDHHLNTASHKRAVACATLFHAFKSFGPLLHHLRFKITKKDDKGKDKKKPATATATPAAAVEAGSSAPEKFKFAFSDIIFWYLHHDKVPHDCEGELIVNEVLRSYRNANAPPQNILGNLRVLISLCTELDFSHQTSKALARRSAWKKQADIEAQKLMTFDISGDGGAATRDSASEEAKKLVADEFFDIDLGMECLFQSRCFDSFQHTVKKPAYDKANKKLEADVTGGGGGGGGGLVETRGESEGGGKGARCGGGGGGGGARKGGGDRDSGGGGGGGGEGGGEGGGGDGGDDGSDAEAQEEAEETNQTGSVDHDSPMNFLVDLLNECDKIQTFARSTGHAEKNNLLSSFPTKQWILHTAGQSLRLHGHGVEHIYETCEVEKTSNVCERWRHMIFSYALSSLLWNMFNGNKEGPIGVYPQRRNQCLGGMRRYIHGNHTPAVMPPLKKGDTVRLQMPRQSGKFSQIGDHDVGTVEEIFDEETGINGHCRIRFGEYSYLCDSNHLDRVEANQLENVYASKENGEPLNYVGHNIVAFAVGKRGDILRVAYNHNVLFTSTVDHAEERLIDSLYRDPAAFVQRSHSEILKDKETIDVEKHMQHISVYTSLEPCQQCSGKMHVALVPEVVFCQRDWDIQLHLGEMYEKFRKTRSVPASHFNFPPYEQLATGYYEFQRLIDEDKPDFFQCMKPGEDCGSKQRTVAKKTMPYFLCTDDCQDVYQRGDFAFRELLKPLFVGNDPNCVRDALDQLVIFHGLNDQCRSDWYVSDPPLAICTQHIRGYRPALNYKQQRILHDELVAKRRQWIQLRHTISCSVTIPFSSRWRDNTLDRRPVSECMVDKYLSPLANIVSVYIPRELNGLLKGNFKVTCTDRYSAARLHKMLSKFDSKTPPEDRGIVNASSLDGENEARKLAATREAVKWLRDIQRTEQPIPRVRIDIQNIAHLPVEQRVPAFALTASAEVGDTKVRKYFDHLCSFSFKDSKRLSVTGSERKAPLSIRIFDVAWPTCLDRMWLNFDGRDRNFALSKRRLWTVEFPSSPQDVKKLYECVDFTPDDILDEFVQPYTQPIFDHAWFCACEELFHNGKHAAGSRVIITDVSAPGMIAWPQHDECVSLIKDIDAQCGISVGSRIMSSYCSQPVEASRLKRGEQGVILFSGRRINGEEFFPVRLDSDHSIYFLSAGSFKVIGSKHVRVCWQPPELPLALFEPDAKKELICYMKITSKTTKYTHHPNHKASRSANNLKKDAVDEKEGKQLVDDCRSFFDSFFGANPSDHLQKLFCQLDIQNLPREQQKSRIIELKPSISSVIKDKKDRELLFIFAGLETKSQAKASTPQKGQQKKAAAGGGHSDSHIDVSMPVAVGGSHTPSSSNSSTPQSDKSKKSPIGGGLSTPVTVRDSQTPSPLVSTGAVSPHTPAQIEENSSGFNCSSLFVYDLDSDILEEELCQVFSGFGDNKVMLGGGKNELSQGTQKEGARNVSRCYAFVRFSSAQNASDALQQYEKQKDIRTPTTASSDEADANDSPFVVRGTPLCIMQMHAAGSKPRHSTEITWDQLRAEFERVDVLLCSKQAQLQTRWSHVKTLKSIMESKNQTLGRFDKFQSTLRGYGRMMTLDVEVKAISEDGGSFFVSVKEATPVAQSFPVTAEMYALYSDNTFCGHLDKKLDLVKLKQLLKELGILELPAEKQRLQIKSILEHIEKKDDHEVLIEFAEDTERKNLDLKFEISERSLATILASDMMRTVTGRQQVYMLLKAAQDDELKTLDWWNEKSPIKVGKGVKLSRLMNFLSDDFVRSSFNFAVKLYDSPRAALQFEHPIVPVTWFSSHKPLTPSQLVQYAVQCAVSFTRDPSHSFLQAIKGVLSELQSVESSISSELALKKRLEEEFKKHNVLGIKQLKENYFDLERELSSPECARGGTSDVCLSCTCMNCNCICRVSCQFKSPILDILSKEDAQRKLFKHLLRLLNKALNGKHVVSYCSAIISGIKNCSEYAHATIHDLIDEVDRARRKRESDAAASSAASSSSDFLPSDGVQVSERSLKSFQMCSFPQRADAVRKFLSTFDLNALELDLEALPSECESQSQPQSMLPHSGNYASQEDIFGLCGGDARNQAHVVEVTNSETLNECIACCEDASTISFQIRERKLSTFSMSWSLLQLCCRIKPKADGNDGAGSVGVIYRVFLVTLPDVFKYKRLSELVALLCSARSTCSIICFSISSKQTFQALASLYGFSCSPLLLQEVLCKSKSDPRISFENLILRSMRKPWDNTWNESGWDVFPLRDGQRTYAVLEVLSMCVIYNLHTAGLLELHDLQQQPSRQRFPKQPDVYSWERVQSCCSGIPESKERKIEISRPLLAPKLTTRNEDPVKEPNASNILHRISELERQLLLELSTPRLNFMLDFETVHVGGGGGDGGGGEREYAGVKGGGPAVAVAGGGVGYASPAVVAAEEEVECSPFPNNADIDHTPPSALFGLQLIIRRQRYDSCPSVSEQKEWFNSGKSYGRFCIDGPLALLSHDARVTFKVVTPNTMRQCTSAAFSPLSPTEARQQSHHHHGTQSHPHHPNSSDMEVELNPEPVDLKRGSGRVYGYIPEIHSHNLQLLFEPEYLFEASSPIYPFLEVVLQVGGKTFKAQVHSFHFKELLDPSVMRCIELQKNLNRKLVKTHAFSSVREGYRQLRTENAELNDGEAKRLMIAFFENSNAAEFMNARSLLSLNYRDIIQKVDAKFKNIDVWHRKDVSSIQSQTKSICKSLKDGLRNKDQPLAAWGEGGQATAMSVLEKFKYFMHHHMELINSDKKDILLLLCQQGKHLERSCQFYLALKYYFAGLHYFRALARSQPALQLDDEMLAISRSFQSLFDNLLPLSNQQVYEQARTIVEYQRGVMQRGTMMK